jgi:hypothetical protein
MVDRHADVRAHRVTDEIVGTLLPPPREQRLDRWADAIDDRPEVAGLIRRPALQFFERGKDGTALRVPHDDDEPRPVARCGKLDAPDLRGRDDVPCHSDDEEITA